MQSFTKMDLTEHGREKNDNDAAEQDFSCMREALLLAQAAAADGEVPVGCVVTYGASIIGRGKNETISRKDPTAHAEILALRAAAQKLGNHRLSGCVVYSTLEPCAMCAGALIHARVAALVYATPDPKAGAAGSVLSVVDHPALNHRVELRSGVLAQESAELLQGFFRERRKAVR